MKRIIYILCIGILIAGCGANNTNQYDAAEASEAKGAANYEEWEADYEDEVEPETEAPIENTSSEKLIYRGQLNIETLEYSSCVKDIHKKIDEYNGLIQYESECTSNAYRWYENEDKGTLHLILEVRIPTEHFYDFLNDLEGSGKIISRSSSIENITKQYNDTLTRIEVLEAQEEKLMEMMEKAESIEEMIAVETRMTEVQSDLYVLRSHQSQMDTDVAYSTVSIYVDEVKKYSAETKEFFPQLKESFTGGLDKFVRAIENFVFFIAENIIFICLIGIFVYLLIKKNILKRTKQVLKKKKE